MKIPIHLIGIVVIIVIIILLAMSGFGGILSEILRDAFGG